MSNKVHKTIISIGRYFHRLGLAFLGKDLPGGKDYDVLRGRVEKAEAGMKELKELYCVVVEKWTDSSVTSKILNSQNEKLRKDIATYQKLVDILRGTIRDKQKVIDAYAVAAAKSERSNSSK